MSIERYRGWEWHWGIGVSGNQHVASRKVIKAVCDVGLCFYSNGIVDEEEVREYHETLIAWLESIPDLKLTSRISDCVKSLRV